MCHDCQPHSASCGGVAQLVRASACHAEGRGFEPRHSRHLKQKQDESWKFEFHSRIYWIQRKNMSYQLSKLQAAGCQIDTAIELLLKEGCEVSACVLIHSAWSIVKDIGKTRGIQGSRDWAAESFPEKKPEDVWKELDSYWQFFKHANSDPDKILDFDSDYLETALMLLTNDFGQLYDQSTSMDVYQLWFIAKYSQEFFSDKTSRSLVETSVSLFPNLTGKTPSEQRAMGLKELNKQISEHIAKQSALK